MKFCQNCGAQLADASVFCPSCGANVAAGVQSQTVQQQQYNQSQQYSPRPAGAQVTATNVLQSFAGSPLFLAAILLLNAQILLDVLSLFLEGPSSVIGLQYFPFGWLSFSKPFLFLAMIPSIIKLGESWILFASAKSKYRPTLSTTSFTMIKVTTIVELVLTDILVAVLLAMGTIRVVTLHNTYSSESELFWSAGVSFFDLFAYKYYWVILILFIIIFTFVILFMAKTISSVSAAKKTIVSGQPNHTSSIFFAVLLFLCALISFLFALIAFARIFTLGFNNYLAIPSCLCSAASYICFGILIILHRSAMRQLMYQNYNAAVPYYG